MLRVRLSLFIALTLFVAAWADPDQVRPLMPEGAYSTTVQGGLTKGQSRPYSLTAQAGQHLEVKLVTLDEGVHLTIVDAKGQSLLADLPKTVKIRNLDLVLPKTGKYVLRVCADKEKASYLLEVYLDDPPEEEEDDSAPTFKKAEPARPLPSLVEREARPSKDDL